MSKSKKKKPAPGDRRRRRAAWLLLLLGIPAVIGLILAALPKKPQTPVGPHFTKEGTLQFLAAEADSTLATIDIEIAENDFERERGLMWRRSMDPRQGMLFIMDRSEPQSFWMLNTYISLDIIFVGEDLRIVNIAARTVPQSLGPVSSTGEARYVVEVVGGFCADHGIRAGDRIAFRREEGES